MAADDPAAAERGRPREAYMAAVVQTKVILLANGMGAPVFAAAGQLAGA